MKQFFSIFCLLFLCTLAYAQDAAKDEIHIFFKDNVLYAVNHTNNDIPIGSLKEGEEIKFDKAKTIYLYADETAKKDNDIAKRNAINFDDEDNCKGQEENVDKVKYKYDCSRKVVQIWSDLPESGITIYNCGDYLSTTACEGKTKKTEVISDITQVPFPYFESLQEELLEKKSNRYLFVDANPDPNFNYGSTLWKRNVKENSSSSKNSGPVLDDFSKAQALPVNSSLGVFVRKLNINDVENITVNVNGKDYTYSKGINDILESITSKERDEENAKIVEPTGSGPDENDLESRRNTYLDQVLNSLKDKDFFSVQDVYNLEAYKSKLKSYVENISSESPYTSAQIEKISKILSWSPKWVLLTPLSVVVPDADYIEIEASIKNSNSSSPYKQILQRYRGSGGLGFNLGGMVYFTELANNNVYTESVMIDGREELRAFLENDNEQSLGIGINGEVVFRTGYMVSPTVNAGFFIPFEEDTSPFMALGPGINFSWPKVKISLSYGLAIGQINTIADRYQDVDLSDFDNLTNESLTKKVWRTGYYFGFGLSYNID